MTPFTEGGRIRTAAPEDLPAIVRIYNHAVMHTVATFDVSPASEALHRRLGFECVGRLREVGRKFDGWVDTPIFQRML